jgi:hypothetical protein
MACWNLRDTATIGGLGKPVKSNSFAYRLLKTSSKLFFPEPPARIGFRMNWSETENLRNFLILAARNALPWSPLPTFNSLV